MRAWFNAKLPPAPAVPSARAAARPATLDVLVIGVGGSHVKFRLGPNAQIRRFESGPGITAATMVRGIRRIVGERTFEGISIGFPDPVVRGRIVGEPHNLGMGWVRYDFGTARRRPLRIVNDATM